MTAMITLNRRKLLELPAAAALAAAPARAAARDTLVIALAARAVATLNPSATTLGADNWACCQIFDTLVAPDNGTFAMTPAEFRPRLAETWGSSADAKTWTFRLRGDAQFHKGYGALSADDVVFTFDRLIDPKTVISGKVLYENIAGVAATDAHTVEFRLKRPDPLFCGSAVFTMSGNILSRKAFDERGDKFALDPIGTGPFQVEHVDLVKGVSLSAFKEYFAGAAATPKLEVRYILDTTARTLAFLSGQVDIIEGARTPGWLQSIKQRKPDTIFDGTKPGSVNTLHLNLTRKPLDDLRVRQAIRYAIDNAALAHAYGEMGGQMWGINPPQFPGSVSERDLPPELRYAYDPDKAKKLLTDAGLGNGVSIPCFTSQREDYTAIMLMVQEQLRKVGIALDMQIVDHTAMHNDDRRDLNSIAMLSSSYPPVPTQALLEQLAASSVVKPDGTGGTNYSHYGVAMPGVDDLLARVLDEPDFARRMAPCQDVERRVLRDLPLLGLITLSYIAARNPRIDLGYTVRSGYAYWPLRTARVRG
ncbi:MAG TPA: ABC transporter substrate-binding protein [Acetobacteraceae bacterium]|jgi:peptide/nickel transport system substrate-binding protein|nr:ABC transporter substrate-binding protein [Acetobacteraceae bacterium]